MAEHTENIFATGIVYDGIGILIRGRVAQASRFCRLI